MVQGRRLIALLKRKRMTYRQMLDTNISNSPWKRVKECLAFGEVVHVSEGANGLVTWQVVKAK